MALQLFFAGLGPMIWHWGLGVGLIIILVGLELFSTAIPVIGPWLGQFRTHLLWAAAAIAIFLAGEIVGVKDAAHRYAAKETVIERKVNRAVNSAKRPSRSVSDRWDRNDY